MAIYKKIVLWLFVSTSILPLSGCAAPQQPAGLNPFADLNYIPPRPGSAAQRFENVSSQGPTAVESAITMSKEYVELAKETSALKEEKQTLLEQNRQLKTQAQAMKEQLDQAQTELAQANNLLREMIIELNNWKTNVMGFREEMREAQKAQLEALLKVLKTLGGEVKQESAQANTPSPLTTAVETSGPQETQKTENTGKSDE